MKRVFFTIGISIITICLFFFLGMPKPGLYGEWRWVASGHKADLDYNIQDTNTEIIHTYKKDHTVDVRVDGEYLQKDEPFEILRKPHPGKEGEDADFLLTKNEMGIIEPYTLLYFNENSHDTLIVVTLDPNQYFQPYVYSVYARVK
ncbi:MAG: hypothetical protein AAGI07_12100 [Bacteroidota bacterium]